jgi:hypothetical protein
MGQKSHPTGVRVGINRKWNTTWFAEGDAYKSSFFAQYQVEQFLKSFFYFYSSVKSSKIKRVWLVDLKWFTSGVYQVYIFIFFYKFKTKKRKLRKLRKKKAIKLWGFYFQIHMGKKSRKRYNMFSKSNNQPNNHKILKNNVRQNVKN